MRVENNVGSVLSLPAVITVTNSANGGGFFLYQSPPTGPFIYDADGITKLSTAFLAQLYAGPSPVILRPIGTPLGFRSGLFAGTFGTVTTVIPDVPLGETVYLQARVWESLSGASFEDARARGGKWGMSPLTSIPSLSPPSQVPVNVTVASFNLRVGSPLFSTGKIEINARKHGEPIQWQLTGASNSRYPIEKRTPPQNWLPLLVVTNTSGSVVFADESESSGHVNFYRARLLD